MRNPKKSFPSSTENEDGTAGLADDKYQDAAPGSSSRKRKRALAIKAPGANPKAAPRCFKRSNATPATRARLRSAVSSSATRAVGGHATRVFAYGSSLKMGIIIRVSFILLKLVDR